MLVVVSPQAHKVACVLCDDEDAATQTFGRYELQYDSRWKKRQRICDEISSRPGGLSVTPQSCMGMVVDVTPTFSDNLGRSQMLSI